MDVQTEAPRPTRLVALQSFSNTHSEHVVLQSVQRFSDADCRLHLNNTSEPLRPFVVNLPSFPSCVVCSWFLCDWWLLL